MRKLTLISSVVALVSTVMLIAASPASADHSARASITGVVYRQGQYLPSDENALANSGFDILTDHFNPAKAQNGAGPDLIWLQFRWADFEQTNGNFNDTILNNLRAAAKTACETGFHIGIRMRAGADSPIGRPGVSGYPAWLTDSSQSAIDVDFIRTWATEATNEGNNEHQELRVPLAFPSSGDSFDDYIVQYFQAQRRVANVLRETISGGACDGLTYARAVGVIALAGPTDSAPRRQLGSDAALTPTRMTATATR